MSTRYGHMGDSPDGSDAAQAPSESSDSSGTRGFFGRILDVFSPPEESAASDAEPASRIGAPALGIGNLRRLAVSDVAVPKAEIQAVPVTITLDALVQVFRDTGFSRLPVYKTSLDSPLGLIHLKDLALQHGFSAGTARFNLRKLLRPLLFVPPSMPIGVLLQKMQSQRVHMALVIDEYGGVDGLVTIEDLIEQVVGEISDEHDEEEGDLWKLDKPGEYLVQARAPLDAVESVLGLALADEDERAEVDTLGGLVFMHAGRVPARGEKVALANGVEAEVVDADARRVKRIRVRLPRAEG